MNVNLVTITSQTIYLCMIYVHPGVPSFAIVVSPDGLVVDGPGWTRPNGAGDLCSH